MNRLTIRNRNNVPHGGAWSYKQAESGRTFRSHSLLWLVQDVKKHRIANNYPIGVEFEEEIEDQICGRNPELCGVPNSPMSDLALSLSDVWRGTKALIAKLTGQISLVDEQTANMRATICADCPANKKFRIPCGSLCDGFAAFVNGIIGGKKTNVHERLHSCAVCKCYISAMVWFPSDYLQRALSPEMRAKTPERCWKL